MAAGRPGHLLGSGPAVCGSRARPIAVCRLLRSALRDHSWNQKAESEKQNDYRLSSSFSRLFTSVINFHFDPLRSNMSHLGQVGEEVGLLNPRVFNPVLSSLSEHHLGAQFGWFWAGPTLSCFKHDSGTGSETACICRAAL